MDKIEKKKTHGKKRSDEWPRVRKDWIKNNPACAVCGTKKNVQVHHRVAFHTHPELELDPTNFITLCEGEERDHHRMIGHCENFQSINEHVDADVAFWKAKIANRPKWDKKTLKWIYPI